MHADREYVVGRLPGRKRPALYALVPYPPNGAAIHPLAYFRDDDDLRQFIRDTLGGQIVSVAAELAREVDETGELDA